MPKIIEDCERSHLGKSILDRRIELGMTQTQLADACGLRQSCISDIERGFSKDPPVGTVDKIADALQTTVDQLLHPPKPRKRSRTA